MRSKDDKTSIGLFHSFLSLSQSECAVSLKNGSDDMFAPIAFNCQVI